MSYLIALLLGGLYFYTRHLVDTLRNDFKMMREREGK